MKIRHLTMALTCAALAGAWQAGAVPAKPGILTVTQKDGTELKVLLVGDESFHQYFTPDGYPLIENDGNFYYCTIDGQGQLQTSGIKAGNMEKRGAAAKNFIATVDKAQQEKNFSVRLAKTAKPKLVYDPAVSSTLPARVRTNSGDGNDGPPYERGYGLFPDERFPAYGNQKAIVILVEYKDVKFTLSDPFDYFNRMLNEDNFSDYGGTGSGGQFYRENSNGAFTPEFDVFGPITLSKNRSYYGGNDWSGDDQHPADMVKEACEQLDPVVDFSEYDRNHDGIVDNVFIFYAGQGEASGGPAESVWPHSWNMASAGYPNLYFDGVRVHTYGCSNEWEHGRPDGVGTFVHEFSHVMGLPDLYATRYPSPAPHTPGSWSTMDYGPYNNSGCTPPNYGAFERYALGYTAPNVIDGPLSATLPPVMQNEVGIIHTGKDTEFFLLENRQQTGWDKYIPGHGMLIWHVDYNESVWRRNEVNNTASHQYCDIEEAGNNHSSSKGDASDPFPGTKNVTSFTANTTPAMKTWAGVGLDYPITDIAESGGIITFNVLGGGTPVEPPTAGTPTNITPEGFTARWGARPDMNHLLSVYTGTGSSRKYLEGFEKRNVGKVGSFEVTGVEQGTTYYYVVAATDGWQISSETAPVKVYIPFPTIDYATPVALPATEVTDNSFTASWNELDQAVDYELYVYTKTPDKTATEGTDFSEGMPASLPEGWTSTSNNTYSMASYVGAAKPSLRLPNSADKLTSRDYEEGVKSLKFWCRGNSTGADDIYRIYAKIENKWVKVLEDKVPSVGKTVEVSNFPVDSKAVRIEFLKQGVNGSLAVDDVEVTYYTSSIKSYVSGFNGVKTDNQLSKSVTGLTPETRYYYTVRATDGTLKSKYSNEVGVTTEKESGIQSVGEVMAIGISGRTVSCDGVTVEAYDATGLLVARGEGSIELPAAGLYIIKAEGKGVTKVIVR